MTPNSEEQLAKKLADWEKNSSHEPPPHTANLEAEVRPGLPGVAALGFEVLFGVFLNEFSANAAAAKHNPPARMRTELPELAKGIGPGCSNQD